MPENIVIDIYNDKSYKLHRIKEGEKCYKLWNNMFNCMMDKNKDCNKKILEWDKCLTEYKKN